MQDRAARNPIVPFRKGTKGWNKGLRNLPKAAIAGISRHHNHLKGGETWFQHSPHTASGETSVHAPRGDAKRANSVGICLAN